MDSITPSHAGRWPWLHSVDHNTEKKNHENEKGICKKKRRKRRVGKEGEKRDCGGRSNPNPNELYTCINSTDKFNLKTK